MLSLYMFYEAAKENENEKEETVKPQKQPVRVRSGHTFTASEAQRIIDANREKPQARTVLHINPKSAADILANSSNSAQRAANNSTNDSLNAGQRASSLTSGYVSRPQRSPSRVGINPTFSASTI